MQRKAQQLVEFAIAVPILMIILFIIIEFGNALNSRATVAEGVKLALIKVNSLSSLDGNTATKEAFVEAFIKNEMIKYLVQHNIPNSASISVKVNAVADSAALLVNYNYNPYFLIPGLLGGAIPDSIQFSSSQSLNPHIFKENVFPGVPHTTWELANFHTDGVGSFIDSGALVSGDIHGNALYNVRENTAILAHFYDGIGTHPYFEYDLARLVGWEGDELLPPNLRINLKTGTLETRSPYYQNGNWFDTLIPYVWVVSSLGINHVIYIKYNTFEMLLADDSNLYYKLRFNITDPFYNRKMRFCGTTGSSGVCNGDQRGKSTINERALRMNPRLGGVNNSVNSGNNDYITGIIEPISIPTDPTHHFQQVNGIYFSYTNDYVNWNSANWNNEYFITLSLPHVLGLQAGVADMADEIYHPDMNDNTKNPFYNPYEYRLKFWEALNAGAGNQGEYVGIAPFAEDGDIDANNLGGGAGWDESEPGGDPDYTMDIVDVYIDSDGDGIPDAWDRDPAYFDVNINGILDGNETNSAVFNTNANRCNDGIGRPLMYEADPVICNELPDNISVGDNLDYNGDAIIDYVVLAGDFSDFEASPGKDYYKATPYKINGAINGLEPGTNIPDVENMDLVKYTGDGHNVLYFDLGGGNYTRKHSTWWGVLGGCGVNPIGNFNVCNMTLRRNIKTGVVGGTKFVHGSVVGNDIDLDPSDELQYLFNQDIFSPGTYIRRTPPVVW